MIYHLNYLDLLIAPIYITFFYLITIWISKKYYSNNTFLRKKLIQGFWIKILATIIFLLITQFVFGGGDTFMYYEFGLAINNSIGIDVSNLKFLFSNYEPFYEYVDNNNFDYVNSVAGYMAGMSNQLVSRLSCVFGFVCFQNFAVISFFFSMLCYIGVWKMFILFYKLFTKNKSYVAISFLFLPSFVFWSSGILKEPICIFLLGLIVSGIYNLIIFKTGVFKDLIFILLGSFFLNLIKNYILYSISLAIFLMAYRIFIKRKSFSLKIIYSFGIILIVFFAFQFVENNLLSDSNTILTAEEFLDQTQKMKENYIDMGGSFIDIGTIDPSITGIIKKTPQIFNTVFFRPYPWEARSFILVLSMLESLFFLLLTIKIFLKTKIYKFYFAVFNDPILLQCYVFSVVLGIIVGLTTFNFGTILRYKIPSMPFFALANLIVYSKIFTKETKIDTQ